MAGVPDSELNLSAEAGRIYYVRLANRAHIGTVFSTGVSTHAEMYFSGGLTQVNKEVARTELAACREVLNVD